ncbi:MAG: hypothetical protein HY474_01620 [Candidatus Sungbacteria bacterium]|uniref:Uncharacterized protein n=1 Tax=Candidatus Sungiibacteriota bacterium TaxID=2750080 RepID=A0A932YY29_9BACT|nr:hypothetical protein [Candidatus Sungbacteria bacterium]
MKPRTVGFLQAAGIAAYVALFATLAYQMRTLTEARAVAIHPIAGITLFLLAFVISALISSSTVLAYPAYLFFGGHRIEALKIIFWSAVGLVFFFILAVLAALAIGLSALFA